MKPVVTGKEMKKIDAYTIEHIGIPSMVLMERAACGLAERMKAHIGRADPVLRQPVFFFARDIPQAFIWREILKSGRKKQKNKFR